MKLPVNECSMKEAINVIEELDDKFRLGVRPVGDGMFAVPYGDKVLVVRRDAVKLWLGMPDERMPEQCLFQFTPLSPFNVANMLFKAILYIPILNPVRQPFWVVVDSKTSSIIKDNIRDRYDFLILQCELWLQEYRWKVIKERLEMEVINAFWKEVL